MPDTLPWVIVMECSCLVGVTVELSLLQELEKEIARDGGPGV